MFRKAIIMSLTVMCLVTIAASALSEIGENRFTCVIREFNCESVYLHFENGMANLFRIKHGGCIPIFERMIDIPAWSLVLLFGCYPTLAFTCGPLRRHRRRRNGLCIRCGYNLEGNVSGVCPECGEAR